MHARHPVKYINIAELLPLCTQAVMRYCVVGVNARHQCLGVFYSHNGLGVLNMTKKQLKRGILLFEYKKSNMTHMKGNMTHKKGNMAPMKGNVVLTKGNMAQRHNRKS